MQILSVVFLVFFIVLAKCGEFKVTDQVYFDIQTEGAYVGRVVIGLFGEVAPKTVANFKQIATNGIKGKTYVGSKFHTIIPRFMIQGGDIINNDGTGSISIYGKHFDDENFEIKHSGPGMVSMANGGRNTNGCQFFITTMQAPWLDGVHTVFGKVVKGQDIVHRIEHFKTDSDNRPLKNVMIIKSGLIRTRKHYYETDESYKVTFWEWIKAGWFPLSFSFAILGFFHWLMLQLNGLKSFE